MVVVTSCCATDLPAIDHLMNQYGKMSVSPEHINRRDIALQARTDNGALVGFIWMGVMAKGTFGYVDKFTVDPAYAGQGVGRLLANRLLSECQTRGVRTVHGFIRQDEYHDKSGVNALKMAMGADPLPYTFVTSDILNTVSELEAS